jgi:hypothetical protein
VADTQNTRPHTANNDQSLLIDVLTVRLACPQVDEMNFAARKTGHRLVSIGIVAGTFLNEKAVHGQSGNGTAKENWHWRIHLVEQRLILEIISMRLEMNK